MGAEQLRARFKVIRYARQIRHAPAIEALCSVERISIEPQVPFFRTELSLISGTPAFVAPETINSGLIDARTDIYSLGIMFFYLLTGRHPLHVERSGDYLSEHLVGIPLTLSQAKRDVHWTEELESLLASMLAKRPEDRPSSCQEILDQLQGGLRELTLASLHEPPSRPSSSSGRLRRIFNRFFKHDR